MPLLVAREAFHLAFFDWVSAVILARISTNANEVAVALDATARLQIALDTYEASLPAGAMDAAAPLGRLRNRIDAVSRWLFGKKSGTMRPPSTPT
jgi:hypothetical protein